MLGSASGLCACPGSSSRGVSVTRRLSVTDRTADSDPTRLQPLRLRHARALAGRCPWTVASVRVELGARVGVASGNVVDRLGFAHPPRGRGMVMAQRAWMSPWAHGFMNACWRTSWRFRGSDRAASSAAELGPCGVAWPTSSFTWRQCRRPWGGWSSRMAVEPGSCVPAGLCSRGDRHSMTGEPERGGMGLQHRSVADVHRQ